VSLDQRVEHIVDTRSPIRFGNLGIQGIAGEYPLDAPTLLRVGRGIGRWVRSQPTFNEASAAALIGHDTRVSSTAILQALATGLMAEGITVITAGVITTPGIAFTMQGNRYDIGIMIGDGKAPIQHNSVRLFERGGYPTSEEHERVIEMYIDQLVAERMAKRTGHFKRYSLLPGSDVHERYVDHLTGWADSSALADLKVVIDCAHGAVHKLAYDAFRKLGASITLINDSPDGTNQNLKAGSDYVRRDQRDILKHMKSAQADLGIALDGTGEGLVLVTPEGSLLHGDYLLGLLALEMHAVDNLPHHTIASTELSNTGLEDFLRSSHIRVTHVDDERTLLELMRESDLRLGGDPSGHITLLDDTHTFTDGLYIALLMSWLAAHAKHNHAPSLDETAAQINLYPQIIASAVFPQPVDLNGIPGLAHIQLEIVEQFGGKGRTDATFDEARSAVVVMVEGNETTTLDQVTDAARYLLNFVASHLEANSIKIVLNDAATGKRLA
jgi:phosphoglucosamine mutase